MTKSIDDCIDKVLQPIFVTHMSLAQERLTKDALEHFFLHLSLDYEYFF